MESIFRIEGEFESYHFKNRLNRFAVETEEGKICHLHDPGRLEELLTPGREIYAIRKYKGLECEIIYTKVEDEFILINSKYHNSIAKNIIEKGLLGKNFKLKKSEIKLNDMRIDFLLDFNEKDYYLEVKGCTLLDGEFAKFPDAPTRRGTHHLKKLAELRRDGYGAGVLFLVFRKARYFMPNYERDQDFYYALIDAVRWGVDIFPLRLYFDGRRFFALGLIEIKIDGPAGI
ncbi:MAG: DNA/RNA nuclease SfsA [Thermoplasmata archaeon]|nr:DNA/RNA nuclease SfsA [Thermoplasmatales archaeon]